MSSMICPICCDYTPFLAYTDCEHYTCAKCFLIQKILCKSDKCLLCAKTRPKVLIIPTDMPIYSFSYFLYKNYMHNFTKYGVFVHPSANFFVQYLENPPCPQCAQQFGNFYEMSRHLQDVHKQQYCRICLKHKPIFAIDQAYYATHDIYKHLQQHPICYLCTQRYYDEQTRYDHYKTGHVRCELCRFFDVNDSYWDDLHALQAHIAEAHFVCAFRYCNVEGFGFVSEEEQLEHIIYAHEMQMDAVKLVDMQRTLNNLRRYKKIVDFAKLEDMRRLYSIESRPAQQARRYSQQYEEDTEAQIYTYIAELAIKKKKTRTYYKAHADVDTFVEFVEPEQSTEQKYRGIQKQQDVSIVLNQDTSPGPIFGQTTTKQSEIEHIFGSQAFKVVKHKKNKVEVAQQAQQQTIGESNYILLQEGLFSEFKEAPPNGPYQLFEIYKTSQTVNEQDDLRSDNLAIKVVKDRKAKKKESATQDVQSEAPTIPLFIIDSSQSARITEPPRHNDAEPNLGIVVKKPKAAKEERVTAEQEDYARPLLFYIQNVSKQVTTDIAYPSAGGAKDVQKNTIPESHIDGSVHIKVCKRKDKKYPAEKPVSPVEEPFTPLLSLDVPIAAKPQEKPKKQLFYIEPRYYAVPQMVAATQDVAKDVQKNTVPESHVDGSVYIKVCKRKEKKVDSDDTVQYASFYVATNKVEHPKQSDDIIVAKAKGKKAHESVPQQNTEYEALLLDLNMTSDEITRLMYPLNKPVVYAPISQPLQPEDVPNDIYMELHYVFNYIPISVTFTRVVGGLQVATLAVEFTYDYHFAAYLRAMYLTFSAAEREVIAARTAAAGRDVMTTTPSASQFVISRVSDFRNMKPFIWYFITGADTQVRGISTMLRTCKLEVVYEFTRNKLFALHCAGDGSFDYQMDILQELFCVNLGTCTHADVAYFHFAQELEFQ